MIPPRVAPNASMIANPSLAALDSDAPWPAFSSLTDNLDVHQVNNYSQGLPEVSSVIARCCAKADNLNTVLVAD